MPDAAAAVVAYSEDRKSKSSLPGGDPALELLDAIQAETVVQSDVPEVLRQAGIVAKSMGACFCSGCCHQPTTLRYSSARGLKYFFLVGNRGGCCDFVQEFKAPVMV